jgi:hypothetical protein
MAVITGNKLGVREKALFNVREAKLPLTVCPLFKGL